MFQIQGNVDFEFKANEFIKGVIINDLNGDGLNDLIVTVQITPGNSTIYFLPYDANLKMYSPKTKVVIATSVVASEPTIFQRFDNQRNLLVPYLIVQKATRFVYTVASNGSVSEQPFDQFVVASSGCLPYSQVSSRGLGLAETKGGSVADLNGDCIPDMVLESADGTNSPFLEFYYYQQGNGQDIPAGFCLVGIVPNGANSLTATFIDLNNDGATDLVLVNSETLRVDVHLNRFTSTDLQNLCVTNDSKSLPYIGINTDDVSSVLFLS